MKTKSSINFFAPLHAGKYYHVYNRTNNKELLFLDDYDRSSFLNRLNRYIYPYLDIFAYCLMGTHFHMLVRIKSMETLTDLVKSFPANIRKEAQKKFLEMSKETRTTDGLLEGQFIRFFTSYAMYFNKRHERNGNLFTRPFKRVEIENGGHLLHGVYYIHANPVKHKTRKEFFTYPWSSYQILLSEEPTRLVRTEVLHWFDGRDGFIRYHREAFENDKGDTESFFE